jgi:hypothetical protein
MDIQQEEEGPQVVCSFDQADAHAELRTHEGLKIMAESTLLAVPGFESPEEPDEPEFSLNEQVC